MALWTHAIALGNSHCPDDSKKSISSWGTDQTTTEAAGCAQIWLRRGQYTLGSFRASRIGSSYWGHTE